MDGKEIGPATPKVDGYGFVSTPAPNPDAIGESPMMTWGEIEGTPFLLDASDRPIVNETPGPIFKVSTAATTLTGTCNCHDVVSYHCLVPFRVSVCHSMLLSNQSHSTVLCW